MCDKLVFDLSQELEAPVVPFVRKDWVNILDNMSGQYGSNQSVTDTSQLSNSNKYFFYRESYLAVPMLLTVATTTLATAGAFLPNQSGSSADYAFGLKNWFGNIIHSIQADYNGVSIIQQTPFSNMWNSFKLMTSLSWGDVLTQGASIGLYPDDPLAWSFESAASASGQGVCNNTNRSSTALGAVVSGVFNSYSSQNGNIGLLKRQQYINYDPAGDSGSGTYGADALPASSCNLLWKSYISRKIDGSNGVNQGVFQISILAQIKLKHLHSFFNQLPLIKGAYFKLTLNLNNSTTTFSSAGLGGALTLGSVSNSVGGINPLMIASAAASQGSAAAFGATDYRANVSVGGVCLDTTLASTAGVTTSALGARSVYLYVPAYTFAPIFENAYISAPVKQVHYTDIYMYQVNNVSAGSGLVNQLLTNGISDLRSVLVLPYWSAASNPVGIAGLPVYQSPYDPAGTGCTSPLSLLTNYNVVVSGQNAINVSRCLFKRKASRYLAATSPNCEKLLKAYNTKPFRKLIGGEC